MTEKEAHQKGLRGLDRLQQGGQRLPKRAPLSEVFRIREDGYGPRRSMAAFHLVKHFTDGEEWSALLRENGTVLLGFRSAAAALRGDLRFAVRIPLEATTAVEVSFGSRSGREMSDVNQGRIGGAA